jgi:hypothetical protein
MKVRVSAVIDMTGARWNSADAWDAFEKIGEGATSGVIDVSRSCSVCAVARSGN